MENELIPSTEEQQPIETAVPIEQPPVEDTIPEETQPEIDQVPDIEAQKAEIEALEKRRKKAEEDAKYWRQEQEHARKGYFRERRGAPLKPIEPIETPAEKPAEKEPNSNDFENYDDYIKALTDHRVNIAKADWEKESAEKISRETDRERQANLQSKLEEGYTKYEDFGEVAFDHTAVHITPMIVDILADCENPADVAYHLAKNRVEGVQISKMTPFKAAREIMKIDLNFSENPKPIKKVTAASPPIKTVGGGKAEITKDPEKMTQKEYEKWRLEQGAKPY